jgi:hypothetical protein
LEKGSGVREDSLKIKSEKCVPRHWYPESGIIGLLRIKIEICLVSDSLLDRFCELIDGTGFILVMYVTMHGYKLVNLQLGRIDSQSKLLHLTLALSRNSTEGNAGRVLIL